MRMRIEKPVRKVTYLTFANNQGITRDTRSLSILDATKDEIVDMIKKLFSAELERGKENIHDFIKLTVKIVDTTDKQRKDEFSYSLYRTDVNAIERIIEYIDGE